MPTVAETPVMVVCLGIACPTGFNLNPDGFDPSYVNFVPGVAVPLAPHYAEWLIAQDPARFSVEKPVVSAQPKAGKPAKK